ncbi:hypothetical protein EV715DRAFT_208410 [Schizophyllum commune]
MSSTTAGTSAPAPVADARDAPYTSETSPKHVLFAPGTAPETVKSRTAAKATTARPYPTASSRKKPRPRQRHMKRHRHMVYALMLTEKGMKSFNDAHFGPAPPGLTEEEYQSWWGNEMEALYSIIPRHCLNRFDLRNMSNFELTFVRDGDHKAPAIVFADNSSRRTSSLPDPEQVAAVAKYIHQEGDEPKWYRVVKM